MDEHIYPCISTLRWVTLRKIKYDISSSNQVKLTIAMSRPLGSNIGRPNISLLHILKPAKTLGYLSMDLFNTRIIKTGVEKKQKNKNEKALELGHHQQHNWALNKHNPSLSSKPIFYYLANSLEWNKGRWSRVSNIKN